MFVRISQLPDTYDTAVCHITCVQNNITIQVFDTVLEVQPYTCTCILLTSPMSRHWFLYVLCF